MQIQAILQAILITSGLAIFLSLLSGFNAIRLGRKIPYYRTRQQRISRGWQLIGTSLLLTLFAAGVFRFGEPLAMRFIPPTPTPTSQPTATLTPTATSAPTPSVVPTA